MGRHGIDPVKTQIDLKLLGTKTHIHHSEFSKFFILHNEN